LKVVADTNLFVRALTGDDPRQSQIAQAELAKAEKIVVALPALCEVVWVLSANYRFPASLIAEGIRRVTDAANVVVSRPAIEAGLRQLEAGGDFADGLIAHEGRRLGADVFLSFDRRAVRILQAQGEPARLL
jgi:predicted nucleic-acid-binding protein